MKLLQKIEKNIETELLYLRKREPYPLDTFQISLSLSYKLLTQIKNNKTIKDKTLISQAKKNFIINCATATEVYFKDIVKVLTNICLERGKIQRIKELLKKPKITLLEAYLFFMEKKYSLGIIISHFYPLLSLENINKVLSAILGDIINIDDFLTTIENFEVKFDEEDKEIFNKDTILLKKEFPEWRKYVSMLFSLRHEFVHHIGFYKNKPSMKTTISILENLYAFIIVTDYFLISRVPLEE